MDMRSFSNLWFWIALAVFWSSASHWVLGVPYDLVARARRDGGQAEADLEDMVRINIGRILHIAEEAGLLLLGFLSFLLTALAIIGFVYDVEFAQALFLLGFPMSLVGALSVRTAHGLAHDDIDVEELHRRLGRHRRAVQTIGMIAIFVTAMWGMYENLDRSHLFQDI